MHGLQFLQDLAVVMMVAGLVTLAFRWLKQPVVLGYLLAGFIIGPHTPPFPLVRDENTIRILADIGVVFLMFSLGLDFSLKKLRAVGAAAFVAASFEIMAMIATGYALGHAFKWTTMESAFLGIMLALTSTTIVVKSLRDAGQLKEKHGILISGVSIFDDIFVIFVMILLPGFAASGQLPASQIVVTLLRLFIFLVAATVVGLLVVPRFLKSVVRLGSEEMLLIVVLALCFGVSLFTARIGFSPALGAFLVGAMVAECRELGRIQRITAPIRDMFSAVFFVAIGMLIDPRYILDHWWPVLLITATYLVTKIGSCAVGALMAGYDGHTAMRFGAGMAQVGEFGFILAALGTSLGVVGPHLYPIIVAVASLNALARPYLVGFADRVADWLDRRVPAPVLTMARLYSGWVGRLRDGRALHPGFRYIRLLFWQLALNVALIAALFIAAAMAARTLEKPLAFLPEWTGGARTVCWLAAALMSLPLYVATVRKMQAMGMMLSEAALSGSAGERTAALRSFLATIFWIVQIAGLALFSTLISLAVLPPLYVSIALLAALGLVIAVGAPALNRWYSRAKFAVVEAWSRPPADSADDPPPIPAALREARMESFSVARGSSADGKLIRELALRSETGASIIAVERAGKTIVNPDPDLELRAGDSLLLLGSDVQILRAKRVLGAG